MLAPSKSKLEVAIENRKREEAISHRKIAESADKVRIAKEKTKAVLAMAEHKIAEAKTRIAEAKEGRRPRSWRYFGCNRKYPKESRRPPLRPPSGSRLHHLLRRMQYRVIMRKPHFG